jgi:TM2 domain-containing membrane protein YozV
MNPLELQMIKEEVKNMDKTQKFLYFESKKKSPTLAVILSLLIPGLGQIYLGRIGKGILFFILTILLSLVLVGFIVWIFNVYDAYKTAEEYNNMLYLTIFSENQN